MSSSNRSARRIFRRVLHAPNGTRAASTIEYAVILVAVLLLAAGSWKLLGGAINQRGSVAGDTVSGGGSSSSGGSSSGAGGGGSDRSGGSGLGGGGRSGGSGGDKATAASKVTVGGVGGAAGEGGGGSGKPSRDTSSSESSGSAGGAIASVGGRASGSGDVTEGFTAKRWFGIGLLAAGVFALGYVVMSMRRAKKTADEMAKDGGSKKGMTMPRGPAPPLA